MRLALDANRYVDLMRGVPETAALVRAADAILLPFAVLAELRAGFQYGTRARENERLLEAFLRREPVEVLWPTDATTRIYARLYTDLRKAGTPIPTHDLWIAALVIEHGLVLCSRDRHFERVPGLARA